MTKIEKWIHRIVLIALTLYEAIKTIMEGWAS